MKSIWKKLSLTGKITTFLVSLILMVVFYYSFLYRSGSIELDQTNDPGMGETQSVLDD